MPERDARLAVALATAAAEVERIKRMRWHLEGTAAARAAFEQVARDFDALRVADPIDMIRLGELVRAVAAWEPEHGMPLIGALGAVVRAARASVVA